MNMNDYFVASTAILEDSVSIGNGAKVWHFAHIRSDVNLGSNVIIGENVYKPWDCLSGIYQIEINEGMGLVARPNGITQNNECVVMVDNYLTKFLTFLLGTRRVVSFHKRY